MNTFMKLVGGCFLLGALGGCSTLGIGEESEFSCSRIVDYDGCVPVSTVYELSEDTDDIRASKDRIEGIDKAEKGQGVSQLSGEPLPKYTLPTPEQPVTILNAPKLARIWIAPWRDQSQVLQMASYAYLIIDNGGFEFGVESNELDDQVIFPLEVTAGDEKNTPSGSSAIPDTKQLVGDVANMVNNAAKALPSNLAKP